MVLAPIVMDQSGCYAEGYVGTKLLPLPEVTLEIGETEWAVSVSLPLERPEATSLDSKVQRRDVVPLRKLAFAPGDSERIVRRSIVDSYKYL
jgi:hypothetical protein